MPDLLPVYEPRPVRPLPEWRIGPVRVKPYHIGARELAPERLASAEVEARRMEGECASEGGSQDLGFAVIHEGVAGTWLLLDWWAHGDILCQRLSFDDGAGFASVDARPLTACVWELPVLMHERDAWIRHMMQGAPSPNGYLADRLSAGTV
ncbi:hypothetical protein [Palleronia sp. LCG004]|uniref:hypothetical protein n=1 Tax=Palleronia sp. LCG004 TaxID=3079304 RepID=UPI002941DB3F|nr:hypothetical protein [Palleronia sp. LCG004]WOI55769.1 hypothetical protein RVY76_12090 [Palleronia sp. LCG004]